MIHVANRAGDSAGAILPYTVHRRRVEWGEPTDTISNPGLHLGGLIPDAMVRFMTHETPMDVALHRLGVLDEDHATSPQRVRDRMDCAVVETLQHAGHIAAAALYATPGSPRAQIITRTLPGIEVLDPDQ